MLIRQGVAHSRTARDLETAGEVMPWSSVNSFTRRARSREAFENAELVLNAPQTTRIGRLDEAAAARKQVLCWGPKARADAA